MCVCVRERERECVCVCAVGETMLWWTGQALMTTCSTYKLNGQLYSHIHLLCIHVVHPLPPPPSPLSLSPRLRLCFSVTEAEVERAKKVFKTSLFMQLDGV